MSKRINEKLENEIIFVGDKHLDNTDTKKDIMLKSFILEYLELYLLEYDLNDELIDEIFDDFDLVNFIDNNSTIEDLKNIVDTMLDNYDY